MAQSKRVGTRRLGWCLDGLHEACIHITPNMGLVCACECHDTPTNTQPTDNDPISC